MKKLLCIMLISICCLSITAGVSAKEYKEFPAPVWTTAAPNGVDDVQVINNRIYALSFDDNIIYNDTTGEKAATIAYPSALHSSSFEVLLRAIDKQGNFYWIVTTIDKATQEHTFYLKAYSASGTTLWTKAFPEKVPSLDVRIFTQSDGTLLTVLKTNHNQYMTYKFNRQGKQLQKKQINGYIDSFYFNTLATLSHQSYTGKFQATLSIYDAALNFKFKQQITDEKFYCMLPDGTLIFIKNNDDNPDKVTVTARNQSGKTLWSKSFASGFIRWFSTRSSQPFPYGFLLQTNHALYLMNSKGLVSQRAINPGSDVQIGSDSSIMIQGKRNLTIVKGSDLSTLHTVSNPDSDWGYREFLYGGKGILYHSADNLFYKYDLN
ncbi:hypothetical protein [Paenibacillus sp. BAC0078]